MKNIDVTSLAVSGSAGSPELLAGAASSAQTYFSADGGRNWNRSNKEPTGGSKTHVLMAPHSDGKAYAATSGIESAFSISQDKGSTWNQIGLIDTMMSTIIDLAPSPAYSQDNTLFMLTFGGKHSLWRSLDGGTKQYATVLGAEREETKEGILFKPKLTTWDLVGSGAKYATVEEMYKLLDKMRAEDRADDE